MKKLIAVIAVVFVSASLVVAQVAPAASPATPAAPSSTATQPAVSQPTTAAPAAVKVALSEMAKSESSHYIVYAETGTDRAADLSARLEALFGLYSGAFHFDAATLGAKLQVREFKNKTGFDAYLNQVAGQTKDDFVYLHYSSLERSELVLFFKDGPDAETSLAHQAFVQYLKAFVKNPPLWIRDGFAVYFESARYDPKAKTISFPENLAWLETAKTLQSKKSLLPLQKLLMLSQDEARGGLDVFYPEAWAFASFLVNTDDKEMSRVFWDSLSALQRDGSLVDNQSAVANRFASWAGIEKADAAFLAYLGGKKTFADLVTEGVAAYSAKNYPASRSSFEAAVKLDATSYVPPYYLGLIAYAAGDYSLAEYNYRSALQLGCDAGTANYALGVNALAQNRGEDAKTFLLAAKTAAPDRYTAKVDELLKRLSK